MAIGNVNFLAAKKLGAAGNMQKAASAQHTNTNATQNNNATNPNVKQQTMAEMGSSDLIKHVYQNCPQVNPQDKSSGDENSLKLPITVEYGNEKFPAMNKSEDEVVKNIAKKTGDSEMKVRSELKRKYANTKGGSLNMQG